MKSKTIDCSICGDPLSFDAAHNTFWCVTCDFDIPGLSPVEPRVRKKKNGND